MTADTSLGIHAQLACIWEASARKPGNVHRFSDFKDVTYLDFLTSAATLGPIVAAAPDHSLGQTILEAVRLRRSVSETNTNLGIILLFAPLARADSAGRVDGDLRAQLRRVLSDAEASDAALVCQAICLAEPAGLGTRSEHDVRTVPTLPLRELMALAADRDLIARQYADDFAEVLEDGVPVLRRAIEDLGSLEGAILHTHLHLMARYPDSLIARKCGPGEAAESSHRARQVLDAGWPRQPEGRDAFAVLDGWLREQGHQRNPGTTADLIAACLFVLLREGSLRLPLSVPWPAF